jgi:hypothetical protein
MEATDRRSTKISTHRTRVEAEVPVMVTVSAGNVTLTTRPDCGEVSVSVAGSDATVAVGRDVLALPPHPARNPARIDAQARATESVFAELYSRSIDIHILVDIAQELRVVLGG